MLDGHCAGCGDTLDGYCHGCTDRVDVHLFGLHDAARVPSCPRCAPLPDGDPEPGADGTCGGCGEPLRGYCRRCRHLAETHVLGLHDDRPHTGCPDCQLERKIA